VYGQKIESQNQRGASAMSILPAALSFTLILMLSDAGPQQEHQCIELRNLIHAKNQGIRELARRKTSAPTLRSLRLGSGKASGSKAPHSIRGKLVEWVLIAIVVLYAAGLSC